MRRKLVPESNTVSSFRWLESESVVSSFSVGLAASWFLLHGCHVAPIFWDMHTLDIGPCPTVRSKDINPNNISSAWTKIESKKSKLNYHMLNFNILYGLSKQWGIVVYLIWSFLVLHIKLFYVSSSTTANSAMINFNIFQTQNHIINMSKN